MPTFLTNAIPEEPGVGVFVGVLVGVLGITHGV
jgi:hypothetical protein